MTAYSDAVDLVLPSLERQCMDDYVGLWAVLWDVRRNPVLSATPELQRKATLELISKLLETPGGVAGQFTQGTHVFEAWTGPTDRIVDRIAREWDALGRDPIGGEIVWLTVGLPEPG